MVFLTNNFKWAASTIAELYKARWEVELLFKELKQALKLQDFYGENENAIVCGIAERRFCDKTRGESSHATLNQIFMLPKFRALRTKRMFAMLYAHPCGMVVQFTPARGGCIAQDLLGNKNKLLRIVGGAQSNESPCMED